MTLLEAKEACDKLALEWSILPGMANPITDWTEIKRTDTGHTVLLRFYVSGMAIIDTKLGFYTFQKHNPTATDRLHIKTEIV
jgi:hypothetical protein